ncbi:hypothetical protein MGN70_000053 [Eutypa lata]|nr:hypothetical protein MGN70_000053 [Eutypa lata]
MLGNRHLHSHAHAHGHGLRHRHAEAELSYANVDRFSGSVDGGATGSVTDGHAPTVLAARTNASDEKPVSASSTNLIIAIGVVVPLAIVLCVLVYLHRRNNKRVALEDVDDKYRSLDFGLGDSVPAGGKKRRSAFFGKEKDSPSHRAQLSMDMNLSSPYLLPPELQNSRESLNSLARSLHKNEDPYRHVTEYTNSEVGSLRSFQRGPERGSSYTNKTGSTDRSSSRGARGLPSSRQNSIPAPTSPLPQLPPAAQTPQRQEFEGDIPAPLAPSKNEFRFTDNASSRGVPSITPEQVPTIQEPPAAASRLSHKAITETVRPFSGESTTMGQAYMGDLVNDRESMPQRESLATGQAMENKDSTRPPRMDSMPVIDASGIQDYQDYSDHFQINEPDHTHPQQTSGQPMAPHPNDINGPASAGLGVPSQDNRRLSVGLRPLPPDDFLESEDPEFRANRIRSFYKEYFEDSKQDTARPPMPTQAPAPGPPQNNYYEDYDQNYLGEAAYFDPETNAFVMPYAAPVTRRAMTPPPSNRRPMPGPRQRRPSGGMSMQSGPGGRPRAGSTMSAGRWAPMSPRPGSSASNPRFSNKPRKPMPPPTDLNTLPTPSKLKDDSFAIFNAMEFAPPPSFKDQAAGRSQSPVGERVPYRAGTPVHSPLVSAFEDTAPLPSPHLLRKSSTFTGLDFAPPRRFKDPEVMSDAGSIRSNQSGLSSQNAMALRNGAGRVSRLPGDTIFTQQDSASTLKPQWGMRA